MLSVLIAWISLFSLPHFIDLSFLAYVPPPPPPPLSLSLTLRPSLPSQAGSMDCLRRRASSRMIGLGVEREVKNSRSFRLLLISTDALSCWRFQTYVVGTVQCHHSYNNNHHHLLLPLFPLPRLLSLLITWDGRHPPLEPGHIECIIGYLGSFPFSGTRRHFFVVSNLYQPSLCRLLLSYLCKEIDTNLSSSSTLLSLFPLKAMFKFVSLKCREREREGVGVGSSVNLKEKMNDN